MLTNNVDKLEVGAGQYTFLLNDEAGIIDDLIVYRIEEEKFLLVVNASRIEDDFAWLQSHLASDVQLENQSDRYAGLAVQGPKHRRTFSARFSASAQEMPARNQIAQFELGATDALGRAHRLHRRRRDRGFLPGRGCAAGLERNPGEREVVRHSPLRARRARHLAPRDVLSAERLRSFARAQSARSRPRFFRRPDETEIHRTREIAPGKRRRSFAPARPFQDEGQRPAAAPALPGLPRRRRGRRS